MKEKVEYWSKYMATVPRSRATLRDILRIMKIEHAEKWIIGKETGRDGYKHWQIRYKLGEEVRTNREVNTWSAYGGHVIRAETDDWGYEAKSGNYICSWERSMAFIKHGNLNRTQALVNTEFKASNLRKNKEAESRKIVVWYNRKGRQGKTYLVKWLLMNHKAVYIPPQMKTAMALIQWAYGYPSDAYVIDMPKNVKNTEDLWGAIETIKDGYMYDPRYTNHFRVQRSPRILVLTNKLPPKTLLSDDRWQIIET